MKVLAIEVGAVSAPTRFSLVRISSRDLVADGNPKGFLEDRGLRVFSSMLFLVSSRTTCLIFIVLVRPSRLTQ